MFRRLREARDLSQENVARRLAISSSYLSLLERGKRPPTMHVIRRLADWLDIAPGLLLLQSLEPETLEPRQRALVEEVQREFEKALSSNDFTSLQRTRCE